MEQRKEQQEKERGREVDVYVDTYDKLHLRLRRNKSTLNKIKKIKCQYLEVCVFGIFNFVPILTTTFSHKFTLRLDTNRSFIE